MHVVQIKHGDHIDYLVEGYLHHPHAAASSGAGHGHSHGGHSHGAGGTLDQHCDVHGELRMLGDDVLEFLDGVDLFGGSQGAQGGACTPASEAPSS